MNPVPVFLEIERIRQSLGLPGITSGAPYTLAILRLGPHEVYGMNTYGIGGRAAGLPRQVRSFLNELSKATHERSVKFSFGASGCLAHAEGDALVTAYNSGFTEQFKQGTMFVDRAVCSLCRGQGGLPRLLNMIGVQKVDVYELLSFPSSYRRFELEPEA